MSWSPALTDVVVSEDDVGAVLECLSEGWLTMGPRTQAFETALADMYGVEHAVAVSSCTAALHLALLGAGIGAGDEVLVPAMTFVAGAAAVRYCGATPVFVESRGPHDLNIDPDDAARLLGPRTRAVLTTHWMGYSSDLTQLEQLCSEHGLSLIEDCAQSIGAFSPDGRLTGTVGKAGCLSFFSKKQLCVGEGGMVLTSDGALADKLRSLRSHAMTSVTWDRHRGYAESYDVVDLGFNFRLDETRAALGLSRLPRLPADLERRRSLVRRYRERLARIPGIAIPWSDFDVERATHFGFVILLETGSLRTRVERELAARRIQTTWYPALNTLSGYGSHPSRPRTEDLADRHLLLPLSSTYTEREVDYVVDHLREIVATDAGP
jgi:dTDP-4-amino-4,6-dideoxygalactose transaminase